MYLGNGVSPKNSSIFLKLSSSSSHKKRMVRPRLVVLSITSATNSSFSPKYNLLPTRIFLAGSTITSHKRLGLFNSRNKKTSILAPVFSLRPYILAGNTFVLFTTNTSLSSKYSRISLKCLFSICPVLRSTTIIRLSSLLLVGFWAIRLSGRSKRNCDNFMCLILCFK